MPTLAVNKHGLHEYNILQTWEAGIRLQGNEVKSVKAGSLNLKGSYITINNGRAEVVGMHIESYKPASGHYPNYNPTANRELLLHKKELLEILSKLDTVAKSTLIPEKVFTKGGYIKIVVALAVGKNTRDKRQTIKDKDIKRRVLREVDR